MVPPERVELSSLAPEASTLSTELQGLAQVRISWADRPNKLTASRQSGQGYNPAIDYHLAYKTIQLTATVTAI